MKYLSLSFLIFCTGSISALFTPRDSAAQKILVQRLDHFSNNPATWNSTYYEDKTYLRPGGPIILVVSVGSPYELQHGILNDISKEIGAYMVASSSRYILNQPTPDASTENLKYLTFEQMLGDLAHLVEHIRSSNPSLANSKVIAVGRGSFGTAASYFRLKYPHLCDGAWAIAANVLAKATLPEFYEIVGGMYKKYGSLECYDRIHEAFVGFRDIFTRNKENILNQKFDLCQDIRTYGDQQMFLYQIAEFVSARVTLGSASTIEAACSILNNRSIDAITAMSRFTNHSRGGDGPFKPKCLESTYRFAVDFYSQSSWSAAAVQAAGKQFLYQNCNEMGWLKTTTSSNQPFVANITGESFGEFCSDVFGREVNYETLQRNVEKFNRNFGGLQPNVTNVYYVSSSFSPYKTLTIMHDLNNSTFADVLTDESPMGAFDSIRASDSESLKNIKIRARELIKTWTEN